MFCLYHAYSQKTDYKWFFIIIIFPLIGSLIYLYFHFYNRKNVENIKEGVKGAIVKNYNINKLEQKVKFSDTFTNKMELAQAHLSVGNNNRALDLYESCYTGSYITDPDLNKKLIQVHYLKENYNEVIKYGQNLIDEPEFKNSSEMTAYAWSLYKEGKTNEAKKVFQKLDGNFCNYNHRLEFAYFLHEAYGNAEALEKAEELIQEINSMDSYEIKVNKKAIHGIKYLYKQLQKA